MANLKKYQDVDLYGLLGVDPKATEKEIRKAYRKKALDCHPDKNPDNPKAAELFHELSLGLEILTDEKARSTYDKYQQAKQAAQLRNDQLEIKRRKLKQDLEVREQNVGAKDDTQCANAGDALKVEIDRLRKEGSRLLEEEQRLMRDHISRGTSIDAVPEPSSYRIKIKWNAEKDGDRGYTIDTLRRYLQKYGEIEDLLMLKDKKGCALAAFKSKESAEMAISYERGDLKNPLKISWISCSGGSKQPLRSSPVTYPSAVASNDFESLVLRNLRQAEERKRLIEQMKREDAAVSGS